MFIQIPEPILNDFSGEFVHAWRYGTELGRLKRAPQGGLQLASSNAATDATGTVYYSGGKVMEVYIC